MTNDNEMPSSSASPDEVSVELKTCFLSTVALIINN